MSVFHEKICLSSNQPWERKELETGLSILGSTSYGMQRSFKRNVERPYILAGVEAIATNNDNTLLT